MGEIDPSFIQAQEHRPKPATTEAEGVPLIDLSVLTDPSRTSDFEGLVGEVGRACEDWGFFQVVNHGVPVEPRRRIEEAARRFFGQGKEEKRKLRRREENVLGYYDSELTKNVRDWKEVFDYTLGESAHAKDETDMTYLKWPEYPPDLREVCKDYGKEMEKLAAKLMELIALSLGLPANRFSTFVHDQSHPTSFYRLNYYPPCPIAHLALGVGRHHDAGALTILAQDDVGGLEVKRKSDGEWIRVAPTPNAYIINIGDTMQVWSNDKYESVEHRVMVNSEKERFSIPFFLNVGFDTIVKPLEELTDEANPPKYREFHWGDFLIARKNSNTKKLDSENVLIQHFRVSK